MDVDLLQFLRTACFGTLSLGSAPEEVVTAMGEPDSWTKPEFPAWWKYGNVQIMLTAAGIVCIQLEFYGVPVSPTVTFADFPRFDGQTVATFEQLLLAEQLTFRVRTASWSQDPVYLLSSGVEAAFGDGRLTALSVVDRERLPACG